MFGSRSQTSQAKGPTSFPLCFPLVLNGCGIWDCNYSCKWERGGTAVLIPGQNKVPVCGSQDEEPHWQMGFLWGGKLRGVRGSAFWRSMLCIYRLTGSCETPAYISTTFASSAVSQTGFKKNIYKRNACWFMQMSSPHIFFLWWWWNRGNGKRNEVKRRPRAPGRKFSTHSCPLVFVYTLWVVQGNWTDLLIHLLLGPLNGHPAAMSRHTAKLVSKRSTIIQQARACQILFLCILG